MSRRVIDIAEGYGIMDNYPYSLYLDDIDWTDNNDVEITYRGNKSLFVRDEDVEFHDTDYGEACDEDDGRDFTLIMGYIGNIYCLLVNTNYWHNLYGYSGDWIGSEIRCVNIVDYNKIKDLLK